MDQQVGQATIFLPLMTVVALTVVALLRLIVVRTRAMRARQVKLSYYRAYQGDGEPEHTAATARHYVNLFEAPVIFYVACVVAFELSAVTPWTLVWAWGYVAARVAQSAIHLTTNNVQQRAMVFASGWSCLIALWIKLGISLAGQI
jgi:hypothetical protein